MTKSIAIAVLILIGSWSITSCSGQANSKAQIETKNQKTTGDANADASFAALDPEFQSKIRPLLVKYCSECHMPGEFKDLDFLAATTAQEAASLPFAFNKLLQQMNDDAMPPSDCIQPSVDERQAVIDWTQKLLQAVDFAPDDEQQIASYVVGIYEDRQGDLWFGTVTQGAARFDGTALTYFSKKDGLPVNAAPSIVDDATGKIWIGTQEGLCWLDGMKITQLGPAQGLPTRGGNVYVDQRGNIWGNMYSGLYRYDGEKFAEFQLPIEKEKLGTYGAISGRASLKLEDKKGNLWFSTNGAGVFKFDGSTFTHFTKDDGLCSNYITDIAEDLQGNLWIACLQAHPELTGDGGVCRFDGATFTKFQSVKGLAHNDIYTIYADRSGNVWIGATGHGVYRYDGQEFTLFRTDRMDLTWSLGLQAAMEDRYGTLWLGFSGGLFRFDGQAIVNVTKEQLVDYAKEHQPWAVER